MKNSKNINIFVKRLVAVILKILSVNSQSYFDKAATL